MTQTAAAAAADDGGNSAADGVARAVKYRLTGGVQGVGFRYYVKQNADKLGIGGWAQNEVDGSLTVLLHGDGVDAMYAVLLQGPPGANVASMVELCVEEGDAAADDGGGEGFVIR